MSRLNLWVTDTGLTYQYLDKPGAPKAKQHIVKVEFVKGRKPTAQGLDAVAVTDNYLIGRNQSKWTTGVRRFSTARLNNLYDGIDLVTYFDAKTGLPRYDLVVRPGADATKIAMRYTGAGAIKKLDNTSIAYRTCFGQVSERDLKAYECDSRESAAKRFVPAARQVLKNGLLAFNVPQYDKSRTLVIDPLLYSTYFGGSSSTEINGIAVDFRTNTAYMCGDTESTDLPTKAGVVQASNPATGDHHVAFVASFAGNNVACTYYGGDSAGGAEPMTTARAIAIDFSNNTLSGGTICVTGGSNCADLPTGGTPFQATKAGRTDAFVVKFKPDLKTVLAQTYLGGASDEIGTGLAVSNAGEPVVAGYTGYGTGASHFPVSGGAIQPGFGGGRNDAFVTRLTTNLNTLNFSTLLGGGRDEYPYHSSTTASYRAWPRVALDSSSNAYVVGTTTSPDFPTTAGVYQETGGAASGNIYDAFVTKLSNTGARVFGTYLGTGRAEAGGVAIDWSGNVWVGGTTRRFTFPVTPGAFDTHYDGVDGFLSSLTPNGVTLLASTFVGGSGVDEIRGIAFNADGRIGVVGTTDSNNFPTTAQALQAGYGGAWDGFVAKFPLDAKTINFGSYLGGTSTDELTCVSPDANASLFVGGITGSTNFPTSATPYMATNPNGGSSTSGIYSIVQPRVQWTTSLSPSFEIVGGNPVSFNVNLPSAAPTGGMKFVLSSTNAALTLPGSLTLAAGAMTGSAQAQTVGVDSDQFGNARATIYGDTVSTFFVIHPADLATISSRLTVVGGSTTATKLSVQLNGEAGPSGAQVFLSPASGPAIPPTSVTIPFGSSTKAVTVPTSMVVTPTPVTFHAFYRGAEKTFSMTVLPFQPRSVVSDVSTATGGTTLHCTLTLNAAPTGNLSLPITYTGPCSGPATVNVPGGSTSVTFDVTTSAVGSSQVAKIIATLNGDTRQASVTITP